MGARDRAAPQRGSERPHDGVGIRRGSDFRACFGRSLRLTCPREREVILCIRWEVNDNSIPHAHKRNAYIYITTVIKSSDVVCKSQPRAKNQKNQKIKKPKNHKIKKPKNQKIKKSKNHK